MPLEAINKASMREKSIHHGHPSTLHLYWARRPLAACRAVLFAQLVDDPSAHPENFPTEEKQQEERERLFKIIEDLVIWENSNKEEVLKRARAEIAKSWNGDLPPIHDPFSGGGSIPLEAQRLGLPAYGSDLNPVAVMIGKAMIEIPPLFRNMDSIHPGPKGTADYRNAEGLAEDVKYYGAWMRKKAFERIGHLYPRVDLPKEHGGGKATVIAWIWARTVPSPDPALRGLPVPLVRSFDLSTKKDKKVWVEPVVEGRDYRFEIRSQEQGHTRHGIAGTVNRNGAFCLVSKAAMPLSYVREQGQKGNMKQRLMAIVAEGKRGRVYVAPSDYHEQIACEAPRPVIDDIKLVGKTRVSVPLYGMETFGDLFTDRQLVTLKTFSDLVHEARRQIEKDALAADLSSDQTPLRDGGTGTKAYAEAVSVYLGFALSKLADYSNSICSWNVLNNNITHLFNKQAIPMAWDFVEVNPLGLMISLSKMTSGMEKSISNLGLGKNGQVDNLDATNQEGFRKNHIISTDPPYYNNIGYADLSDFFFLWMKPALKGIYPDLFSLMATPKSEELVATPYRHGGRDEAEAFFLNGMGKAIKNMADNTSDAAPATIYYAFKQKEIEEEGISSTGWATFLQAVINAGYAVVGTWPMRTERAARMVAIGTNALANSVVLVCRRRDAALGTITRAEFIRQIQNELPKAIAELKSANIAPADIPQSSIGPGIGIFSRYQAVLEPDDRPMSVKSALQIINQVLGDEQGDYDPETSFAITWFELHGFEEKDFGLANNIANAKAISVKALVYAGIARAGAGSFNLCSRDQLEEDWNPATDKRVTIWECCQHLIERMENKGEAEAAKLMKQIEKIDPNHLEDARELAYELYDIAADKLKDAREAAAYNGLIAAWPELTRQAASISDEDLRGGGQRSML